MSPLSDVLAVIVALGGEVVRLVVRTTVVLREALSDRVPVVLVALGRVWGRRGDRYSLVAVLSLNLPPLGSTVLEPGLHLALVEVEVPGDVLPLGRSDVLGGSEAELQLARLLTGEPHLSAPPPRPAPCRVPAPLI